MSVVELEEAILGEGPWGEFAPDEKDLAEEASSRTYVRGRHILAAAPHGALRRGGSR